jgi:hypothetical protein
LGIWDAGFGHAFLFGKKRLCLHWKPFGSVTTRHTP